MMFSSPDACVRAVVRVCGFVLCPGFALFLENLGSFRCGFVFCPGNVGLFSGRGVRVDHLLRCVGSSPTTAHCRLATAQWS